MNIRRLFPALLLSLAVLSSQTGCRSKKGGDAALNPEGLGPANPENLEGPLGPGALTDKHPPIEDFAAVNDPRVQTVYFAYDSSTLSPSESAKVSGVVDYLRDKPGMFVLVEGHCDDRGSNEYNMALGERRALTIRETLASMGVSPNFIVTISYGEEMPAATGGNESAWQQNRRGEFKFSAGK